MALTTGLLFLFLAVAIYSCRNIARHAVQAHHDARAKRMRIAVDWRTPPSKRKAPKSRISQMLDF